MTSSSVGVRLAQPDDEASRAYWKVSDAPHFNDRDLEGQPHLLRGQADALVRIHRIEQVSDELEADRVPLVRTVQRDARDCAVVIEQQR